MGLYEPLNLSANEIEILEIFVKDVATSCCAYSDLQCYNCPLRRVSNERLCAKDDEMFAGLKLYEVSKIILDENNDIYWRE